MCFEEVGYIFYFILILSPSCADCLETWKPQPPGTLKACQTCNGIALPLSKKSHIFTLNTIRSRTTVYTAKSNYGCIQTGLIKLTTTTLLHKFACLPAELEYRPWIQGVNSRSVPCQPDFQYKSIWLKVLVNF